MSESESPDDEIVDADVVEDANLPVLPGAPALEPDYTLDGVPTFDYVRDKIESKFATSLGSTELAGATPEAAAVEDEFAAREQKGRDRLEEIRRAMRGDK